MTNIKAQFDTEVAEAEKELSGNPNELTVLDGAILEQVCGRGGPQFGSFSKIVEN